MYNWGIVGSDLIAEDFIHKLTQSGRMCKIALCTNDKIMQEYSDLQYYDTIEELYEDEDVQIIYISTYVDMHQDIILKALQNGLHVLGEKPLFQNAENAKKAYRHAMMHRLLLAEANTLFYMPVYKAIEQFIHEGKIGKLKMIRCDFGSLKEESKDTAVFSEEQGGGALLDIGIYALTATMMFLHNSSTIQASMVQHHYGVDEAWNIMIKNDKQQIANVSLSIRCKMDKRFIITGDKGYIEIYNYPRTDQFVFVDADLNKEEYIFGDTKRALLYEIEMVEKMISSNKYKESRLELTCNVMEIMDQIREEVTKC